MSLLTTHDQPSFKTEAILAQFTRQYDFRDIRRTFNPIFQFVLFSYSFWVFSLPFFLLQNFYFIVLLALLFSYYLLLFFMGLNFTIISILIIILKLLYLSIHSIFKTFILLYSKLSNNVMCGGDGSMSQAKAHHFVSNDGVQGG